MNKEQKLENWAEREIQRNMHTMIVPDDQGGFIAFGKYWIQPTGTGYAVKNWADVIHEFGSKRTAISYCIADKNNLIPLAIRIKSLDTTQQFLANDIRCRQLQCSKTQSQNFYDNVDVKVQPTIARYQAVTDELEKCLNRAKYIQIRGFHNETARIYGN
jgi:hypothetical protein